MKKNKIETLEVINRMCREAARINASMDYVSSNLQSDGFIAGFPNFHQADSGTGVVFGIFLIRKEAVEFRDISGDRIGNPDRTDLEGMFRIAANLASEEGFPAAIPTLHHDPGNNLYGFYFFKSEYVDGKDVKAADLGNPNGIAERFRAVNDYSHTLPYNGAFPNFHQADHGQGVVYGTMFIKGEAGGLRDIPLSTLNMPFYENVFCGEQETNNFLDEYFKLKIWPNVQEFGVRIGNPVIAHEISKLGTTYIKNTDYNKIKIYNFSHNGNDLARKEIHVKAKGNIRKYENNPVGSGRYQTFNQDYKIKAAIELSVADDSFKFNWRITDVDSGFAGGLLGFIMEAYNTAFLLIEWLFMGERNPDKLTDSLLEIGAVAARLNEEDKSIFTKQNKCIEALRREKILYPKDIRIDDFGVWFIFGYQAPSLGQLKRIIVSGDC